MKTLCERKDKRDVLKMIIFNIKTLFFFFRRPDTVKSKTRQMHRYQFYMLTTILIICLIFDFQHQTKANPIEEVTEVNSIRFNL